MWLNKSPLPRASSPYLDDRPGASEQPEPETDEDIDITEYTERDLPMTKDLQNPNMDLV